MVRGHDDGGGGVQPQDFVHLSVRQREVEDVEVLAHTLDVYRLGDDDDAALREVTQGYLSHRFPVPCADGGKGLVGEETVLPLGERPPTT